MFRQFVRVSIALALATMIAACAPKPSVVIVSPPSGSQFSEGEEVPVQSVASDPQGVVRVELFVDGAIVRMDQSPSPQNQFTLIQKWKATAGAHTIIVRSYNAAGEVSDPAAISVSIVASVAQSNTPTTTPTTSASAATPTTTPTPAPSPTAGPSGCNDNSAFVADVTIPDGTSFAPSASFTKTWRLSNIGTCTWTTGFHFVFVSGTAMTASTVVVVPNAAPGSSVDLAVPMTAPASAGNYTGQWRLRNATGSFFGASVTVKINVAAAATATNTAPPSCPGPPVIASFSAAPNPITAGGSTTLSWGAVTNATSATIDHGIGGVPTPGSTVVTPGVTTTYTLTATGCGGVATSQFTVVVNPAAPVLPATTQVLQQVTIAAGGTGSAQANCPSGSVLTGGGFASQSSLQTEVYTQSKGGNGWEVFLYNTTGAGQLVNAYAICLSNTSGSTTQVLQQVSVPANSTGSALATCPAGSIVTGGGYASQANLSTKVFTQSKSGNGWEVFMNNATGSSQLLNAYAICLSGTSGSSSQVLHQVSVAPNTTGSATTACPSGSVLTGGGFASQSSLSTKVFTQSKDANGWEVFLNNATGSSQLVNAYAICAMF